MGHERARTPVFAARDVPYHHPQAFHISGVRARHRVHSPTNDRRRRRHERCRSRAQILWYVVKIVAKARKELSVVLEYVPTSLLVTVLLKLLAPASLSVLSSIRSSCIQITGGCDRINDDGGVASFKILLLPVNLNPVT